MKILKFFFSINVTVRSIQEEKYGRRGTAVITNENDSVGIGITHDIVLLRNVVQYGLQEVFLFLKTKNIVVKIDRTDKRIVHRSKLKNNITLEAGF